MCHVHGTSTVSHAQLLLAHPDCFYRWGTMYQSGDSKVFTLAIEKLLLAQHNLDLPFSTNQECAVLSQRLALDINSSAYLTSGKWNHDMSLKVQTQIASHMRVCVAIPKDLINVRGIAASEPILSEAASYIMRVYHNFDLCDALMNVLNSYSISHGEKGELLVAAFFTSARDQHVNTTGFQPDKFGPPSTSICPIFTVMDLLRNLFQEDHFNTIRDSSPSVCREDFSSQKFGEVFGNTKMHFNHH